MTSCLILKVKLADTMQMQWQGSTNIELGIYCIQYLNSLNLNPLSRIWKHWDKDWTHGDIKAFSSELETSESNGKPFAFLSLQQILRTPTESSIKISILYK